MTNAVTVSAPSTGCVGVALAISGTVTPATDTVSIALSQQKTTLPLTGFLSATTADGTFAGALVPVASGTWYVWAWDQATGLYAVSAAITVPSPDLAYILAVPISAQVVASLLGNQA